MRSLATIQEIGKLEPILGADAIEKATVLGWELVVKKGEFRVGDKCIYIEVDSIVPETQQFEFLRARKFRVRTIRLRGQVSQGLALPIVSGDFPVGTDVTEKLGIRKYDPQGDRERAEMERQVALQKNKLKKFFMRSSLFRRVYNFLFGKNRGSWPSFIQKTDEERIQKMPTILSRGLTYDLTEKLDGQSGTYFKVRRGWRTQFGVCSRNFLIGIPDNSTYWQAARKYDIKKKLRVGEVIQGEILSPKVQGNKYCVGDVEFYVFNMIRNGKKLPTHEMIEWCNAASIPHVPVLATGATIPDSVPCLVESARGFSTLRKETIREGIVCRNYENNVSFKVINPDFLLNGGEE